MTQRLYKQTYCLRCKDEMQAGEEFAWENKSWLEKKGIKTIRRPAHAYECLVAKYDERIKEENKRDAERSAEWFDANVLPLMITANATAHQIAETRQYVIDAGTTP